MSSNYNYIIKDKGVPIYPKDDIRNSDPNLFYRGKDGKEYYTIKDLESANRIYESKFLTDIPEQPIRRRH